MEKISKKEIKNSSMKPKEVIVQSKECLDSTIKSTSTETNTENESNMFLGTYDEAPKFLQDNEFIKRGYLLNCNTIKKIFKSFFILHNETVNIWSHILGAFFFFSLIWYTIIFITNVKTQISNIRNDASLVAYKAKELKEISNDMMNSIYKSMKEIESNFKKIDKEKIYTKSIYKINYLKNELKNFYQKSTNIVPENNSSYNYFVDSITSVKEEIIDLINLDTSINQENGDNLDNNFNLNLNKRKKKNLARWPLFIIILGAITCLSFSAIFHLFGLMNAKYNNILSRFDYGGISLLISGSCYPPYYYFFYYSKLFKFIYLIFITIFGIGTFLYSLTDDFNKPKRRSLRGTIYLIFGLCTGIPILHMAFFGDKIDGYNKDIYLVNWYLGGISYVIGALFYIFRFPEKKYPRTFDYFGASHQIFHVLVFFGALFHFMGSLDAYNYRFRNLKVN